MPTDLPAGVPALTAAERQRRYRDMKRERNERATRGKSRSSGKGGRKPSQFESGEFVAIDGEGFSEGPEHTSIIGQNNRVYIGKEHFYALLAASDGTEVYNAAGRLDTATCLNFVLDIKRRNPRAIVVCFGGSYDICQFLAYGLSREQCIELQSDPDPDNPEDKRRRRTLDITLAGFDYRLEYRPRKSLSIWRWVTGEPKYARTHKKDGSMRWEMTEHDSAVVWDVWGFFQDSFTGVMKKWIPNDPDYQFIVKNKGGRNVFERSEIDTIRRYNQAELRCLVEIMNNLRDAVDTLGLQIKRWDGAGAIAAAMLKHHDVKAHMALAPAAVFEAARYAYSGGHIEAYQIGYYDGTVHHYDVNSAYPSVFRDLPSLSNGVWKHGTASIPPDGFTVVRVRYQFHHGNSFYPLFHRDEGGSIIYPARGEGWYWYPEFEAAREYAHTLGHVQFQVVEWWHFRERGAIASKPFRWIDDYYAQRQLRIAAAKAQGLEDGPEKIIKLGLNSIYGKTAQQVGARENSDGEIEGPPYFQLEWAGYVTAGCRAKLMQAALQNPTSIIALATDGLFSTQPLDLDCPSEKILGAWEYQTHDGMTMVMPGVYWLHENGAKPKHYSRGFKKEQMSDAEFIHRAWQYRRDFIELDIERLIGLGTACVSDNFWNMRGRFVASKRELALNGDNSKRYPVMLYKAKPHLGLAPTWPRDHDMEDDFPMSAPYEISWMGSTEPLTEDMVAHENAEEREIEDADLS